MFDIKEFVIDNLKKGYENGSFTAEQINLFAVNYLTKGILVNEDVEAIATLTVAEDTESEEL